LVCQLIAKKVLITISAILSHEKLNYCFLNHLLPEDPAAVVFSSQDFSLPLFVFSLRMQLEKNPQKYISIYRQNGSWRDRMEWSGLD
jgi:hypothetical protein